MSLVVSPHPRKNEICRRLFRSSWDLTYWNARKNKVSKQQGFYRQCKVTALRPHVHLQLKATSCLFLFLVGVVTSHVYHSTFPPKKVHKFLCQDVAGPTLMHLRIPRVLCVQDWFYHCSKTTMSRVSKQPAFYSKCIIAVRRPHAHHHSKAVKSYSISRRFRALQSCFGHPIPGMP